MEERLINQYFFNFKKDLFQQKFLKQINLKEIIIREFFDSKVFKDDFEKLIINKTFDIWNIFDLLKPLYSNFDVDSTKPFIENLYRFTVNLAFKGIE